MLMNVEVMDSIASRVQTLPLPYCPSVTVAVCVCVKECVVRMCVCAQLLKMSGKGMKHQHVRHVLSYSYIYTRIHEHRYEIPPRETNIVQSVTISQKATMRSHSSPMN